MEKEEQTIPITQTRQAPPFPNRLTWFNVPQPLDWELLRGKIILLSFFTASCINCRHIQEDLRRLADKYPETLAIIGIHSPKYTHEQDPETLRLALARLGISYPVVHDRDLELWGLYGVQAWPTVALVDPLGILVGALSGEAIFSTLDRLAGEIGTALAPRGLLDRTPFPLKADRIPESMLAFPEKILVDPAADSLFIADTNHHRILRVTLSDGRIAAAVGTGREGTTDGSFRRASFRNPLGLAGDAAALYVADGDNHAIRRIDFGKKDVRTLAGTGEQAREFNVGGPGSKTPLNSPCDLALIGSDLYIAMAGAHQVWRLDLKTGDVSPVIGSLLEARIDGPLRRGALSESHGLAAWADRLFIADSQVNAIRAADLTPQGRLLTLAGGDLFDFGDRDGEGKNARFQFPTGLATDGEILYVADTYNHKIRRVRLADGTVDTLCGTGEPGGRDGRRALLHEPTGLALAGEKLFIADRNNHAIRWVDRRTGAVDTLDLRE